MIKLHTENIDNCNINILGDWLDNDLNIINEPFNHIIIDNFLQDDYFDKVTKSLPNSTDNFWEYMNPLEVKYALDRPEYMNDYIVNIFNVLSHPKVIEKISNIFGIQDLEYDPYMNGAGLHYHPRNGRLNMHLDYEQHPILKDKQRRLNIIFYLNKSWKKEWNGSTDLWNYDMTECCFKSYPVANRVIIFETTENSWHGVPDKILCPQEEFRKTLAFYYISPLTSKISKSKTGANKTGYRTKATFVKRPTDPNDIRMKKLYEIRPNRRITKEDLSEIWPDWTEEV